MTWWVGMSLGVVGFAVGVAIALTVGKMHLRRGRGRRRALAAHPASATPLSEALVQMLGFGPDPWQVGAAYDRLDVGEILATGKDPIAELAREFGCTQRRIVAILRSGMPSSTGQPGR